jgi:hypothetical protein
MAMIELHRPGPRELRWFGVIVLALFGVIGAILRWQIGSPDAAFFAWVAGAAIASLYYAIPPLRFPLYLGWMRLVLPIGLVVSHVFLGLVYFVIISPMALAMRAFGRDKLDRRFEADAASYWSARGREADPARYLRQS